MAQLININSTEFRRCNLSAIQSGGTWASIVPDENEIILISTTNSLTADGSGECDAYIVGDGTTTASALELLYVEKVVNNLTDGGENVALSAEQGKVLNLKIEGSRQEVTTENLDISTSGYSNVYFSKPMPAGAVITATNASTRTAAYLMRADGTFITPLIGQLSLPYTTNEEFVGVKANGTFNLTITYSVGVEVEGVKDMIEDLHDEIDAISDAAEQILDAVGSKPSTSISVQGVASYGEVLFDEILPTGSVIMSFTSSANKAFYLTDANGVIDTSLISTQLVKQLPYITTKDYRGIKAEGASLITINLAPVYGIDGNRKQIKVNTTDTQIEILEKFRYAFFYGNIDIFFEHGTYTLDEVYLYMKNTLKWTWTMGLPVGNGCRYFLNGSTIISNAPASSYSDDRNIFDTKASATSFEFHDANLILNGGTYCIHDEAQNAAEDYSHFYHNVKFINNGGTRCVGVGTGFNASLSFDLCDFKSTSDFIAVHAPTSNPNNDPVTNDISVNSCYFDDGMYPISINPDQLDTSRDDVTLRVSNCRFTRAISSVTESCVNSLKLFNNQNT